MSTRATQSTPPRHPRVRRGCAGERGVDVLDGRRRTQRGAAGGRDVSRYRRPGWGEGASTCERYTDAVQTQNARPAGAEGPSTALLTDISRAVRGLLPPMHGAVLFGSRATGAAAPRSDWDIGITGLTPLDGAIVERIREALEDLPTLSTFDVVDLAVVPDGFRARASREGVPL